MDNGFELRGTHEKGEGVFATRPFQIDETVMVGVIDRELDRNHSHASQVSAERFVLHGGLVSKVNHSCEPNCGVRLNAIGAHDFVARAPIAVGDEITFDYAIRLCRPLPHRDRPSRPLRQPRVTRPAVRRETCMTTMT
ncbi:MAG: SET domain-containing protein [Streptomycetaceae bacterium]|nr:SET domain-containing protein [Streptomycetaceae bacterium]